MLKHTAKNAGIFLNTRYIVSRSLWEYAFELNKMRDLYKFTRHTAVTQLINARVNAATSNVLIVHRSASIRLIPLTSQGNFSGSKKALSTTL